MPRRPVAPWSFVSHRAPRFSAPISTWIVSPPLLLFYDRMSAAATILSDRVPKRGVAGRPPRSPVGAGDLPADVADHLLSSFPCRHTPAGWAVGHVAMRTSKERGVESFQADTQRLYQPESGRVVWATAAAVVCRFASVLESALLQSVTTMVAICMQSEIDYRRNSVCRADSTTVAALSLRH